VLQGDLRESGRRKVMGGHPYFYFVAYNPDINAALQELRSREFQAGRYNPAMHFPPFPVDLSAPAPGPRHASIDAALYASGADGTRSILDLTHISAVSEFCAASPLADDDLIRLFGTAEPTHQQVDDCYELFEDLERGMGVYVVVYKDAVPEEIFFAGYSFD
jgi:hypothetical protein